jgi:hypothetical protein
MGPHPRRPTSAGGKRAPLSRAWEPERPCSADRLNATWGGRASQSVASLARAEMAARERLTAKQEVLHQLALRGNASSSNMTAGTSHAGTPATASSLASAARRVAGVVGPRARRLSERRTPADRYKEAREKNWAALETTSRGIPAYDASRDKHCTFAKSQTFKRSPYGRMAEASASRELKRLAAPQPKLRHPTRRNSDLYGFAMTENAYNAAARQEVVRAYDRAAREVTRRELTRAAASPNARNSGKK